MKDDKNNLMWQYEKSAFAEGYALIAGIDEAGRGPLAGPVVSAAVILPDNFFCDGLTDSKKLSAKKRELYFKIIFDNAIAAGVGIVEPEEIDRINILQASLLSMRKALDCLSIIPDYLLVDGIFKIASSLPQLSVKSGDSLSISIAAASVIAKVTRDRIMQEYAVIYPEYGFSEHKGYPTKAHKSAIRQFGVSPIHRRTFSGVKECL